jgi:hypothetical protein
VCDAHAQQIWQIRQKRGSVSALISGVYGSCFGYDLAYQLGARVICSQVYGCGFSYNLAHHAGWALNWSVRVVGVYVSSSLLHL